MAMVCPECNRSYDQHLQCPTCGGRLLYQANLGSSAPPAEEQWQQTPWARLVVGLLLAQGLAQGLRLAATAAVSMWDDQGGHTVWLTLWGLVLWHGLQGVSLILGGALAGAGHARGIVYGALIGLANGLIFLVVQQGQGDHLTEIAMYGQPFLHLIFGGLGGLLGMLIWKPLPRVKLAVAPEAQGKGPARLPEPHAFSGPIYWVRVLAGCAIVVGGTVWSQSILNFVLEASQGKLNISSHLQAQLVSLEITAFVTLFGGAMAGATTRNGMKQGLCVGIGAAIVLIGIHLGNQKANFDSTVFMMFNIVGLTTAGGWFGGQLFPPLLAYTRHRSDSMV